MAPVNIFNTENKYTEKVLNVVVLYRQPYLCFETCVDCIYRTITEYSTVR